MHGTTSLKNVFYVACKGRREVQKTVKRIGFNQLRINSTDKILFMILHYDESQSKKSVPRLSGSGQTTELGLLYWCGQHRLRRDAYL